MSSNVDWDKVRIFCVAAEAKAQPMPATAWHHQSAVSRQVSALERDLNVPLFHRHCRH